VASFLRGALWTATEYVVSCHNARAYPVAQLALGRLLLLSAQTALDHRAIEVNGSAIRVEVGTPFLPLEAYMRRTSTSTC
jgi:hypothetical protein